MKKYAILTVLVIAAFFASAQTADKNTGTMIGAGTHVRINDELPHYVKADLSEGYAAVQYIDETAVDTAIWKVFNPLTGRYVNDTIVNDTVPAFLIEYGILLRIRASAIDGTTLPRYNLYFKVK